MPLTHNINRRRTIEPARNPAQPCHACGAKAGKPCKKGCVVNSATRRTKHDN